MSNTNIITPPPCGKTSGNELGDGRPPRRAVVDSVAAEAGGRSYDPAVDEVPPGPPGRVILRPKIGPTSFTRAEAKAAVAAANAERLRRRTRAEEANAGARPDRPAGADHA